MSFPSVDGSVVETLLGCAIYNVIKLYNPGDDIFDLLAKLRGQFYLLDSFYNKTVYLS